MARYGLILGQNEAYSLYEPIGSPFGPIWAYIISKFNEHIKNLKKENVKTYATK